MPLSKKMLQIPFVQNLWRKKKTLALSIVTLGVYLSSASSAYAHEAKAVSWKIGKAEAEGKLIPGVSRDGDTRVSLVLSPNHKEEGHVFLVSFLGCEEDAPILDPVIRNLDEIVKDPSVKPYVVDSKPLDPRWSICPAEKNILVDSEKKLDFLVDFIRAESEGMSVVINAPVYLVPVDLLKKTTNPDELAKLLSRDHPAADLTVQLFYRVDAKKSVWQWGTYEKVFGSASDGNKLTRDYTAVKMSMPVNLESFTTIRQLPVGQKLPSQAVLMERIKKAGSGLGKEFDISGGLKAASSNDILRSISSAQIIPLNLAAGEAASEAGSSYSLSGVFSSRWSADHALHPGFGFRVEAWTNETGSWKKLASDWVQWNGSWNLTVPASSGYQGNHLRVLYRSYNQYYQPQNQSGNTYSWRDPDRYNIGNSFNAGHRYADTDGGEFNGVGELVDAAMVMWSRLYWSANVNPVPASAIQMNFPNTWYDCGDGSGDPWSCATFNGDKIWLIASHGRQANVVAHELAHALQAKYWNKKWPKNSGGSHTLTGCYSDRLGMALSEGFANFIPAWVGYPARNTADGGFNSGRWALGLDPEKSSGSPNCANGWENETWVARTFWDLHDTRADNNDILWFNHVGAVINLYLANPVANNGDAMDMRDFENIYRNAASAGHQSYISDIFNQNKM